MEFLVIMTTEVPAGTPHPVPDYTRAPCRSR